MSVAVPVSLNYAKDKLMQRCIIPVELLKKTKLAIGDVLLIQTSENKYICRIFTSVIPHRCIFIDSLVCFNKINSRHLMKYSESTSIPDNLTLVKPQYFEHITVEIISKDDGNIVGCDKTVLEEIAHKLLKTFVVTENVLVNCDSRKLAELFHINSISICEILPKTIEYGRISNTATIEVNGLMSGDQICDVEEFRLLKLGGVTESLNMLKSYLRVPPYLVLICGPSGSGKSSLVRKFLSEMKCFFVILDGLKNADFSKSKCDKIYDQFRNYLKIFPDRDCVLFIDHIDVIAPHSLKQKVLTAKGISNLGLLIKRLESLNVCIIAAASLRKNINHNVSSLFLKEINLHMPSLQQRKEIVQVLAESLDCNFNYDEVAQLTPGFVAHDLSLLVKEAISINKKKKYLEKTDRRNLTTEDIQMALKSISPSVLKTSIWNMKVEPVYWKDIGGMFSIKEKLQMCIEEPLHNPELFKEVGLPCPHGVLLFGPPGCCKTTLARGLATECNANFFSATPAQIYSPYVGESEKNITELFYQARLVAPSIIFLDELDSLVSQRKLDKKSQGIGEKVLSALLNEMDGFGTKVQFHNSLIMEKVLNNADMIKSKDEKSYSIEQHSNEDVIVVAATNRPDLIDDALLRPGRFDVILYVPPPNKEERRSILETLTRNKPVQNVDLEKIAEKTDFFSGADLKKLCNEAAKNAFRHDKSSLSISEDNFYEALEKVQPSITKQQIEMYEKLSIRYGLIIK